MDCGRAYQATLWSLFTCMIVTGSELSKLKETFSFQVLTFKQPSKFIYFQVGALF